MKFSCSIDVKRLLISVVSASLLACVLVHVWEANYFFNVFNEQGELLAKTSAAPFMIIGAIYGVLSVPFLGVVEKVIMYLTRSKAEKEADKAEKVNGDD